MKVFSTVVIGFLFYLQANAQIIKGSIVDADSGSPVPFTHIAIAGTLNGTSADIDGRFALECVLPAQLIISSVGYTKTSIEVKGTDVIVTLQPQLTQLMEVVITPGRNPAHLILDKVHNNIPQNDHHKLDSYAFTSYNKLSITLSDDATALISSSSLKTRIDSSDLFICESVVNHKFKKHDKFHEHIIKQQTAGTKNPLLATILTDLQPMSFYEEWFFMKSTDKSYLNPLFDHGYQKYDFELLDTLFSYPDSTFVILFQPQEGKYVEGLKGVLYISSDGFAVESVEAQSCNKTDGFGFSFQQRYQKINGRWFPRQLNTDIYIQDKKNFLYGAHYIHKSYLSQIEINLDLLDADFTSTTRDLAQNVSEKDSSFWIVNRVGNLGDREANAYKYYKQHPEESLDLVFNTAEAVSSGFIRKKRINIPINRLLAFNKYERVRLGIGFQTNDGFSKVISYGAFAGWGIEDKSIKYGTNLEFKIKNRSEARFSVFYEQDLSEPASTISIYKNQNAIMIEGYRGFLTSRMDSVQRFGTSLSFLVGPRFSAQFRMKHEIRNPTYGYRFVNEQYPYTNYEASEIGTVLRYAKGEKRLNLGAGAFNTSEPDKLLEFEAAKSVAFPSGGLEYFRMQALGILNVNARFMGKTTLHVMGGYVSDLVPYAYLFNGRGTSQSPTFFYIPNTFQTMGIYEFASSQYASIFITQNLGSLLWRSKTQYSVPELKITHGAYWGKLANLQMHELIDFKVPEKGFYEAGVMIHKMLRVRWLYNLFFIDIGVGGFYRYGKYAYPSDTDNLTAKLIIGASI